MLICGSRKVPPQPTSSRPACFPHKHRNVPSELDAHRGTGGCRVSNDAVLPREPHLVTYRAGVLGIGTESRVDCEPHVSTCSLCLSAASSSAAAWRARATMRAHAPIEIRRISHFDPLWQ